MLADVEPALKNIGGWLSAFFDSRSEDGLRPSGLPQDDLGRLIRFGANQV